MTPRTAERLSAEERRAEIVSAAMEEFAVGGLHGTSTQAIARRVGVSQPYLFQLFDTKKKLFIAAVERGFWTIRDRFHKAGASVPPGQVLMAMKDAYVELLADRTLLLLQMQAYAASHDEEVREVVRSEFARLYRFVEALSGASPEELQKFFAHGMLMNVAAALELGEIEWAKECFDIGPASAG